MQVSCQSSASTVAGGGSVVFKSTAAEDLEKPRHIYRIRKTDYAKLPPIQPTRDEGKTVCCWHDDSNTEEHFLERYVKDLLPDIACHPAALRKTTKSPAAGLSETELKLWREGDRRRAIQRSHHAQRCLYRIGAKLLAEQPDFNRDMLNKEVEIKRILESHRPMLLRSLRGLRYRGYGVQDPYNQRLEVEGHGGTNSSAPSLSDRAGSTLADSALGESGFGFWEGSHDTDYMPSQRTLVTGDQDRALHSLSEMGKVEEPPMSTDEEEEEEEDEQDVEDDELHDSFKEDIQRPPSVKFSPKPHSPPPSPVKATKPATPKQPTPAPIVEEEEEPVAEEAPVEEAHPAPPTPEPEPAPAVEPPVVVPPEPTPEEEPELPAKTDEEEDDDDDDDEDDFVPRAGGAMSNDILGINAMLMDTDEEQEEEEEEVEEKEDEEVQQLTSRESTIPSSVPISVSPPQVYVYKPPPPKVKTPTPSPSPPPPPPTPPPPVTIDSPPVIPEKKPLPKPPKPRSSLQRLQQEEIIALRKMEQLQRAKQRSREKAEEMAAAELEASLAAAEEFTGNEGVDEILDRFTIVDKSRLNYLYKIFHDYIPEDGSPFLNHQEMKRALSNIKTCTKISRNQLKFIELVLGLNKERISFHTFAVMATLMDHMSHKDPATLAMFDSIDMTRLQHDLPRLKRLFHCVSERDDFGWPKLTTKAMDIELRAACVPETTRTRLINELDPESKGEITIFDFIVYTPLWIHLHDGIVDNPFSEASREIASPVHRRWGVSVLWLPEQANTARDPRASPASACGSERSTPSLFVESPKMRMVQGEEGGYSEDEEESEGIVNSDDGD